MYFMPNDAPDEQAKRQGVSNQSQACIASAFFQMERTELNQFSSRFEHVLCQQSQNESEQDAPEKLSPGSWLGSRRGFGEGFNDNFLLFGQRTVDLLAPRRVKCRGQEIEKRLPIFEDGFIQIENSRLV